MPKRVILITGTPAVGKTTLAQKLAQTLNAQHINLTYFAKQNHLILEEDTQRDTLIIDEAKMKRKLRSTITKTEADVVVDGHYAAAVTPKSLVTNVFVLRRNPHQLRSLLQQRGYSTQKQNENLQAEALDVCLVEALQNQDKQKICEIDTTNQTTDETLTDALAVLEGKKACYIGIVDWLSMLEREGKTDEYLNT
jgi:adenylate kinase